MRAWLPAPRRPQPRSRSKGSRDLTLARPRRILQCPARACGRRRVRPL